MKFLIALTFSTAAYAVTPEITPDGHFRETDPVKLVQIAKDLAKTPDLPVDDMPTLVCRDKKSWTDQANDISFDQAFEALNAMIPGELNERQKEERRENMALAHETLLDRNNGKDCGLTDVEIDAVNFYSIGKNDKINEALRNGDKKYDIVVRLIKSAMGKIQKQSGIVYRGAKFYSEEEASLYEKPGTVLPASLAFLSTSRVPSEARKFGNRLLVILAHSCVDISIFSLYPNEREILCQPGKVLKLLAPETETDDQKPVPLYLLEELTR